MGGAAGARHNRRNEITIKPPTTTTVRKEVTLKIEPTQGAVGFLDFSYKQ